jgi:hypothetical protein
MCMGAWPYLTLFSHSCWGLSAARYNERPTDRQTDRQTLQPANCAPHNPAHTKDLERVCAAQSSSTRGHNRAGTAHRESVRRKSKSNSSTSGAGSWRLGSGINFSNDDTLDDANSSSSSWNTDTARMVRAAFANAHNNSSSNSSSNNNNTYSPGETTGFTQTLPALSGDRTVNNHPALSGSTAASTALFTDPDGSGRSNGSSDRWVRGSALVSLPGPGGSPANQLCPYPLPPEPKRAPGPAADPNAPADPDRTNPANNNTDLLVAHMGSVLHKVRRPSVSFTRVDIGTYI